MRASAPSLVSLYAYDETGGVPSAADLKNSKLTPAITQELMPFILARQTSKHGHVSNTGAGN